MQLCMLTFTGMSISRQTVTTLAATSVVAISVDTISSPSWITNWRVCITFINICRDCKGHKDVHFCLNAVYGILWQVSLDNYNSINLKMSYYVQTILDV